MNFETGVQASAACGMRNVDENVRVTAPPALGTRVSFPISGASPFFLLILLLILFLLLLVLLILLLLLLDVIVIFLVAPLGRRRNLKALPIREISPLAVLVVERAPYG